MPNTEIPLTPEPARLDMLAAAADPAVTIADGVNYSLQNGSSGRLYIENALDGTTPEVGSLRANWLGSEEVGTVRQLTGEKIWVWAPESGSLALVEAV